MARKKKTLEDVQREADQAEKLYLEFKSPFLLEKAAAAKAKLRLYQATEKPKPKGQGVQCLFNQ